MKLLLRILHALRLVSLTWRKGPDGRRQWGWLVGLAFGFKGRKPRPVKDPAQRPLFKDGEK